MISRARKPSIHGFGVADVVGSLARGGDCLSMGIASEAEAAAARSRLGGAPASIRFVEPREGGALSLDAFAIPRDAPRPDQGLRTVAISAAARQFRDECASGRDRQRRKRRPGGNVEALVAGGRPGPSGVGRDRSRVDAPARRQIAGAPHDLSSAEHPHRHGRSTGARVPAGLRPRIVKTPNIDALARAGVVFESAYCASPLCSPSRASFMSGLLPSRTRVYDNAAEFAADIPTFAHHLRRLGYRTVLSGKMHFCGPISCTASRAADHRHLPRGFRLDAGLGSSARAAELVPQHETRSRRPASACAPTSSTSTTR